MFAQVKEFELSTQRMLDHYKKCTGLDEEQIRKHLLPPEDIESRSMGSGGEDLIMSKAARHKFPYSIECKNQEKLNIWAAWEQANGNKGIYEPLVVIKKNGVRPLVVLDAENFLEMIKDFNDG